MLYLNNIDNCLLAIPNVTTAEAKTVSLLQKTIDIAGGKTIDIHSDIDHYRSVFTIVGDKICIEEALFNLYKESLNLITIDSVPGVHPRIGVVDVTPIVCFKDNQEQACKIAESLAKRVAYELEIPVFFYEKNSLEARSLPSIRKGVRERTLKPDLGPLEPHPTFGYTVIGVREILIAINYYLNTDDLEAAKEIAQHIRESSGGIKGVRALGFLLETQNRAQVSVNIYDTSATDMGELYLIINKLASYRGYSVEKVEIVGTPPAYLIEKALSSIFKNEVKSLEFAYLRRLKSSKG